MPSSSPALCAPEGLTAYLPASAANPSQKLQELGLEEMDADEFKVGSEIGQGRFKTVYAGYHKHRGAVAILRLQASSERNEARMLGLLGRLDLSYFHFPEFFGAKVDPSGDLLVAQEISMLGSVRSVLQEPDLAPLLTPTHRLHVAAQLSAAVDFLDTTRIIHTDIACRNVLVFQLEEEPEMTTVKLTDFGLAACLPPDMDYITSRQPQATRWCAPETVASMRFSRKTDVWSLGATLWELFADGMVPWSRCSKRADVTKRLREVAAGALSISADVSEDFPAPEPGLYPSVAHTAVLTCLRIDESMRPLACEAALVFEDMVDLCDMFGSESQRIDEGLEMVWAKTFEFTDTDGDVITLNQKQGQLTVNGCSTWTGFDRATGRYWAGSGARAFTGTVPYHTTEDLLEFLSQQAVKEETDDKAPKEEIDAKSVGQMLPPRLPAQERSRVCNASTRVNSNCSVQHSVGISPLHSVAAQEPSASLGWSMIDSREDAKAQANESDAAACRRFSSEATTEASSQGDRSRRSSRSSGTPNPSRMASTPSAIDTPNSRFMRSVMQEGATEKVNHFENLKGFLSSPVATQTLSSEQLDKIEQEVASAQMREVYWSGITSANLAAPAGQSMVLPLEPRGGSLWGVRDQTTKAPLQSGKWTLWTYLSPALQREDFTNEHDARAALSSQSESPYSIPCVLRDPSGRVLGGTSWEAEL